MQRWSRTGTQQPCDRDGEDEPPSTDDEKCDAQGEEGGMHSAHGGYTCPLHDERGDITDPDTVGGYSCGEAEFAGGGGWWGRVA